MSKILDTPYVYFELQDDLLIATYKKNLKITLEIAKQVVKTRLEFVDYKPMCALAINAGVKTFDKPARDFLASDAGVEGIIAGAILLGSPLGSFLGNFYLSVSRPKVPIRLFSKKEAAIKWLKQFNK